MSSYMFCLNHGMELLRLDSEAERESFQRAVKFNWLNIDDEIFIDGKIGSDRKWQLVGDGNKLKKEVYGTPVFNLDGEDDYALLCLVLKKNGLNTEIRPANCLEMKQFACQKISGVIHGPKLGPLMKVDVQSRFFQEIGSIEYANRLRYQIKSTYFVNRNYHMKPMSALNFCSYFGMRLVEIDETWELEFLTRQIIKQAADINNEYFIRSTRSGLIENFSFGVGTSFNLKNECMVLVMDRSIGKARIKYANCRTFNRYSNFICEQTQNLYLTDSGNNRPKIVKNIAGMKLLGKLRPCKATLSSHLFDS